MIVDIDKTSFLLLLTLLFLQRLPLLIFFGCAAIDNYRQEADHLGINLF